MDTRAHLPGKKAEEASSPLRACPLARYIATNWARKLKETFNHANISAGKDVLLIRATAIHLEFLSKV